MRDHRVVLGVGVLGDVEVLLDDPPGVGQESPLGADGIWPAESVRSIIEAIGSPSIEAGIHVGVVNDRGFTTRGPYDGGEKERNIAARYKRWAQQASGEWPRTSRILRRLAEEYEREAGRHDAEAQVSADTQ